MLKISLNEELPETIDRLLSKRIEAIELSLSNDQTSEFNEYGEKADIIYCEIRDILAASNKDKCGLMFDYERDHAAMWLELVRAAYLQGFKDSVDFKAITELVSHERESTEVVSLEVAVNA